MNVPYRLAGYSKATATLFFRHDIPQSKFEAVIRIAKLFSDDAEARRVHPVTAAQTRRLANVLNLAVVPDLESYDWLLVPAG